MSALSKTFKTAAVIGVGLAALISTSGAASANGGNWAAQLGPAGSGCYAWTNWTSSHVTAHVYEQANLVYQNGGGMHCYIDIQQRWRSTINIGVVNESALTTGSGNTASVPNNAPYNYYYYGPAGRNGATDYLCVYVFTQFSGGVLSGTNSAKVVYGDGCPII